MAPRATVTRVDLAPILTPTWLAVGALDVAAWPLRSTDGAFVVGSARTARAYAGALGARLPNAREYESIAMAARDHGVLVEPRPKPCGRCSTTEHTADVLAAAGVVGESTLLVNAGKPWLSDPCRAGRAVIYGWWVAARECSTTGHWRGLPTYATSYGMAGYRVIQPWSDFHSDDDIACGYESHIVLVRDR